ncbi:MAG: alanine--tRNA ligase [Nitrospirae bacterium]|nr:alanine--tRNA ligase [Nitrospirota bacterium]
MTSNEIRQLFIDFFREKEHTLVPSSPLIPKDDPTLLFTSAGMVQFKPYFLGMETPPYKRAVTVQKCLRAGGKHNDLENVGRTARHHTFFEMLGNFSFGDYFKKEASIWAWEFLTDRVKLPADRLQITVFEKDAEASDIWQKEVGVKPERIFRLGEKDNFWQMGDTGPCGPCSEILIDQGEDIGCGRPDCAVGCDCDRFLEIWNLVFMQYERDSSGKLTPLPKPCIDTGMGVERLSAALQGKHNNFHSDLFMPVIRDVESRLTDTKKKYGMSHETDVSMNVIADHLRAAVFVLSEGLLPSNEGRGYVLRRIIRRAARHGFMLGFDGPFLYKIMDSLLDIMSGAYLELMEDSNRMKKILRLEEERFSHTLASGMSMLAEIIKSLKSSGGKVIPGQELFRLYDTYGFPLDIAQDIAKDNGILVDEQGFEKEMEIQKTRARASWTGGEARVAGIYKKLLKETGPTEFLGYETTKADAAVKSLIKNGVPVDEAKEGDEVEVILDRTPFYGESGGQAGDKGIIRAEALRLEVTDTKKISGIISHICIIRKGIIRTGMTVHLSVDEAGRRATMRNHTATHLLQAALRSVLGDHIKQAGSFVEPERLRFDFTHFSQMDEKELAEVEDIVNEKIMENVPVNTSAMGIDEAISSGATALFGEKYGEKVRVVRAGDFSAELCGGTHCNATGEIGLFKINSEGSVAAGIRRIEAVTGLSAINFIRLEENELRKSAGLLKVGELNVSERLKKVITDLKSQEKELQKLKGKTAAVNAGDILDNVVTVNNIKVLSQRIDGYDMKTLRHLADTLKDKIGSGILALGSVLDGQAFYITAVTKDLTARFDAGELLKTITGGKGGGRPDMAQGGTKDTDKIDKTLNLVYDIVRKTVTNDK